MKLQKQIITTKISKKNNLNYYVDKSLNFNEKNDLLLLLPTNCVDTIYFHFVVNLTSAKYLLVVNEH